jgi:predicted ArsR family transcriptional regulator
LDGKAMPVEHNLARNASQDLLTHRISMRGCHVSDVRAANRASILEELAQEGPLSRIALARRLNLSRTTVSHIVADLLTEGCVREDGELPASEVGGRRATLLWLCKESDTQE